MPRKKQQALTREGEPKQAMRAGLEIPVPTRDEFFGGLRKVKKDKAQAPRPDRTSESDPGNRAHPPSGARAWFRGLRCLGSV